MLPSSQSEAVIPSAAGFIPGATEAGAKTLTHAFEWFSSAAASLEHSYAQLQGEVVRLRQELQHKGAELDRQREAAGRMQALAETSAVLAHEIRNPLAGMELFTDLLLESGRLDAEPRAWTLQLQAGLRSMTATVNNVLQLNAEPGAMQSVVRVGKVVSSVIDFLSPIAEQARVALCFEDLSNCGLVQGDAHRLQQVFLNIALNALAAMPSGGELMTSVQDAGKFVTVRMQDSGNGIRPVDLPRIFDAGFTTKTGGVGLGLTLCRRIIEQHGGEIAVESILGEGTTFVLTLPAL